MKIAIGSDHAGFRLKEQVKDYLDSRLIEYEDFGTFNEESTDYPRYAEQVAKAIINLGFDGGILICGTGIGMSIAAKKFNGPAPRLAASLFLLFSPAATTTATCSVWARVSLAVVWRCSLLRVGLTQHTKPVVMSAAWA